MEEQPDYLDDTLDDVAEEASKLCQIKHMHCAVHTFQLAIRDILKDPKYLLQQELQKLTLLSEEGLEKVPSLTK